MANPFEIAPVKKETPDNHRQEPKTGDQSLVDPSLSSPKSPASSNPSAPSAPGAENIPNTFPPPPGIDNNSQPGPAEEEDWYGDPKLREPMHLLYGDEAKLRSIVGKMTLYEAYGALDDIRSDLDELVGDSKHLFVAGADPDNPDNPFANLASLYNPDNSGLNSNNRTLQLHRTARSQLTDGRSSFEELLRQEKKMREDPFDLERLRGITDTDLQAESRQAARDLNLANATPEQRQQNEQRLSIDKATREDPDWLGPLTPRLKVPEDQLTQQQREVLGAYRQSQSMRRAHAIVSEYVKQLDATRDQLAMQERSGQSLRLSDYLPSLSLFTSKTTAQDLLARLAARDKIEPFSNGINIEPKDGRYIITIPNNFSKYDPSSEYKDSSNVYRVSPDQGTVTLNTDSSFSLDSADIFYPASADGKPIIKAPRPGSAAAKNKTFAKAYVLDSDGDLVQGLFTEDALKGIRTNNAKKDAKSAEKAAIARVANSLGDIGADGTPIAEQSGTVSVGQNPDRLILNFQSQEKDVSYNRQLSINLDGSITYFEQNGDSTESDPTIPYTRVDIAADGRSQTIQQGRVDELESETKTLKEPKPGTEIKTLDGTVITINKNLLNIQRKHDLYGSDKDDKSWTVDVDSGDVSFQGTEENTIENYVESRRYVNEDSSRKIITLKFPPHHNAQLQLSIDYNLKTKELNNVSAKYERSPIAAPENAREFAATIRNQIIDKGIDALQSTLERSNKQFTIDNSWDELNKRISTDFKDLKLVKTATGCQFIRLYEQSKREDSEPEELETEEPKPKEMVEYLNDGTKVGKTKFAPNGAPTEMTEFSADNIFAVSKYYANSDQVETKSFYFENGKTVAEQYVYTKDGKKELTRAYMPDGDKVAEMNWNSNTLTIYESGKQIKTFTGQQLAEMSKDYKNRNYNESYIKNKYGIDYPKFLRAMKATFGSERGKIGKPIAS